LLSQSRIATAISRCCVKAVLMYPRSDRAADSGDGT
jgi:hypothetical protein